MIDEKKLIKDIRKLCSGHSHILKHVCSVINSQPKISGWIPCSERMPEYSGHYLVRCSDATVHEMFYGRKKEEKVGHWERKYVDNDNEVKSWMPKPEPYPFWEDEDE